MSSARNFGLPYSQGEYIIFLDGDDYLDIKEFSKFLDKVKEIKYQAYLYSFALEDKISSDSKKRLETEENAIFASGILRFIYEKKY